MLPNRNHYRYRYQYRYRLPAIKNRINIFFESIFFVSAPKIFFVAWQFLFIFCDQQFSGKKRRHVFFCLEWKEGSIKKIAETFKRQLPFQWAWRQWSKCCLFVNFKPAKNVFFRFLQRPGKVEKFGRADQTQNYSQSFMIEVFSDTFIRKLEE